jgi:hypothetical protein
MLSSFPPLLENGAQSGPYQPSSPKVRTVFGDDVAVFDEQTTPGDHPPVVQIIISNNGELRFHVAVGVRVVKLARLDKRMKVLLLVFKPNRHRGGSLGVPEKIEVITEPLALIKPRNGAEKPILTLKSN